MATNTLSRGIERRRSQRVLVVIPVEIAWATKDGAPVNELAETEEVSAHGALLRVKTHHPVAAALTIVNPRTRRLAHGKVVWTDSTPEGTIRLAVGLDAPSEALWGISIPPATREAG